MWQMLRQTVNRHDNSLGSFAGLRLHIFMTSHDQTHVVVLRHATVGCLSQAAAAGAAAAAAISDLFSGTALQEERVVYHDFI